MKTPPAMTWRYLLPADVSYTCDSAPPWFQELTASAAGSSRILVSWNNPPQISSTTDYAGLVAINSGRPDIQALTRAGFTYIRRFAVLPNIQSPRWFVPLDSPAVSAAAFCLYTPARMSARLKRFAVRLATRTRLPFWYRDQIWIAQRQTPPLEAKLQSLLNDPTIRLALSSGAPEPARNRKVSVAILGSNGHIKGFAKLAGSRLSRRLLEHEARVLPALAPADGSASPAARILFAGEVDGTYLTVQSPLQGRSTQPRLTPAHHRFLQSLQTTEQKPAAATDLVATLPARIAALPPSRLDLIGMLDDVMPVLQQLTVPVTIVHGDFAPWNLREEAGTISAFDWEYGQPSGLPLLDEFHYRLQIGFLLDNWPADRAFDEFDRLTRSGNYAMNPSQVRALQVVHLLDILTRLLDEGYDEENDMVAWYCKILDRMSVGRAEVALA